MAEWTIFCLNPVVLISEATLPIVIRVLSFQIKKIPEATLPIHFALIPLH